MFYSADPEATRALRDGFADYGYGRIIRSRVPGDFTVELFEPSNR